LKAVIVLLMFNFIRELRELNTALRLELIKLYFNILIVVFGLNLLLLSYTYF